MSKLKKFISYLWGKRSELSAMSEKDGLLAKLVLDIHRKRSHTEIVMVPLFHLFPIHPINRENAIQATLKRTTTLIEHVQELKNKKQLSSEMLQQYIPSVSAIKVVGLAGNEYVAFEGNGRLYSLQKVFSTKDSMEIEVELYNFKNMEKIARRVNRVRKLHNLL